MEHISLAIVSDNKEYSKALGMAVLNICNDFAIKIFSCGEFFKEKNHFILVIPMKFSAINLI